jgi:hypothetical protein
MVSKRQKVSWHHRLQHRNLIDEQHRSISMHRRTSLCRRKRKITIKPLDNCIELVQQFFEPELIDLVDYYEQHLIVLPWIGKSDVEGM